MGVNGLTGSISNCSSASSVYGGDNSYDLGGLVGYNYGSISSSSSNSTVSGGDNLYTLGGLVGVNVGGISKCSSTGNVYGKYNLGGLVGYNYQGSINNCSSASWVNGGDNSHSIGGLVGGNESGGTISNCSSTGNVDGGDSSYNIGGLAGRNDNSFINKCYSTGNVNISGGASYNIGGLVGDNGSGTGTISNCYSTGNANGGGGASQNIGGLVGYNAYNINNCSSTGDVTGTYTLGGLVGWSNGNISNSYSTGAVSGETDSDTLGGLVGDNSGGNIINCYSTGTVAGSYVLGGLVGFNDGTVTACFWDMDTSGQLASAAGTGLSTADMMMQHTFTGAGWDFVGETTNGTEDIWAICENVTYPQLRLSTYSGGSGTVCDPYKIATACDLLALAAKLRDYDRYFILTADIDLGPAQSCGQVFTTAVIARDIDNSNYNFDGVEFTGSFDGDGHKISNLTINTGGAGNDYLGLFGAIGYGSEIKNLRLENVSIISITSITSGAFSVYLGGMSGQNNGSISNCSIVGDIRCEGGGVSLYGAFGGLTGRNLGSISNCFTTGTVTGGDGSIYIGGMAGASNGTINNCYSTDEVTGGNDSGNFGGLVGDNSSSISNSYSTGAVTGGDNSSDLGGLVGHNDGGSISNCYFLDRGGPYGEGTPLSDTAMKQQASFVTWDFVDIWRICEGVEYPTFIWQYVPMSSPTGVSATDSTYPNRVNVTWNPVSDADKYEVYRSDDAAGSIGWGWVGEVLNSASPSFDDYSAAPGIIYYYWVQAMNNCKTSDLSIPDSGFACPVPLAPTGVSASDGTYAGKVQVTWNAVSGASAYEVFRNTINDNTFPTSLGEQTSPYFNDTGVTPGTTYYYWVKAINNCRNVSVFSSGDSGFACPIPPAPTGVSAGDEEYIDHIEVTWDSVSGASAYEVFRNTINDNTFPTSLGEQTSPYFNDTGVTPGTIYYYWVKAINNCRNVSVFSSGDSGFACPIPPAPTGVSAGDEEYIDHIEVTWDSVSGNTYNVWRSTIDDIDTASDLGSQTSPFDDYDVDSGTIYYYWVRAENYCGAVSELSSDSGYAYTENLSITKATVAAGKSIGRDDITISGKMHATVSDLRNADYIEVTMCSDDMPGPCVKIFPINRNSFKALKGTFNFSGYEGWISQSKKIFTYNSHTRKFTVKARNTDLSGMSCPLTLRIQIGSYIGKAELNEPVVNGKKPIPSALMLRIR